MSHNTTPLPKKQSETKHNGNKKPTSRSGKNDEAIFNEMVDKVKQEQEQTQPSPPPDIKLPFHVLGFNNQRQVLIWHKGKIIPIPAANISNNDIKLLAGNQSEEQGKPSPYTAIKDKIIALAHEKGLIDDEEPIKSGIWKLKNDWIIVSGKRAATVQDGVFSFLETPLVNNRTIEFERSSWIDLDRLKDRFEKPNLVDVFEKVRLLISQWNWADSSMPDYIAAFIILQLFQHAMKWRPWIYLLGAAHTGKSSFIEYVLERLLGCLIKRLDKSTGHATAQAIGWSGRIPVFDEFEKNKHMSDVLETMKLSNRGGMKTSGTTGDKHKEFSIHHQPWFASIYLPRSFSSDQAQLSRIVKFELKRVTEGKSIIGILDDEAQELVCDIVTAVISAWPQIESEARKIEQRKESIIKECDGKISGRTVDNFMYAMALLSLLKRETPKMPAWAIGEIKDDGENILESIIMSKIKLGYNEYLVIDLIHKILEEVVSVDVTAAVAKELLRNNGLSVVKKPSGWCLAIRCKDVEESLFKSHSDYQRVAISAPLERIDGAEKGVKTEWGANVKQRALHIPGRHINAITDAE